MHQFQSNNGGHDRGRQRGNGVFQTSLDFDKIKALSEPFNAFFENNLS